MKSPSSHSDSPFPKNKTLSCLCLRPAHGHSVQVRVALGGRTTGSGFFQTDNLNAASRVLSCKDMCSDIAGEVGSGADLFYGHKKHFL